METGILVHPRCEDQGALKPSLVEWKLASSLASPTVCTSLETFLSGMETHLAEHLDQRGILLETFLSGMETNLSQIYNIRKNSLKPSLVEWKPASSSILGVRTKEP